jgi:hypothetical protein
VETTYINQRHMMTESYEKKRNDRDELIVSMISSRDIAIANRDKVPTGTAMCVQRLESRIFVLCRALHVRLELCLILASFAPLAKLGCPTRPLVLSLRKPSPALVPSFSPSYALCSEISSSFILNLGMRDSSHPYLDRHSCD